MPFNRGPLRTPSERATLPVHCGCGIGPRAQQIHALCVGVPRRAGHGSEGDGGRAWGQRAPVVRQPEVYPRVRATAFFQTATRPRGARPSCFARGLGEASHRDPPGAHLDNVYGEPLHQRGISGGAAGSYRPTRRASSNAAPLGSGGLQLSVGYPAALTLGRSGRPAGPGSLTRPLSTSIRVPTRGGADWVRYRPLVSQPPSEDADRGGLGSLGRRATGSARTGQRAPPGQPDPSASAPGVRPAGGFWLTTAVAQWPGQDSNLRATDYESAALTN